MLHENLREWAEDAFASEAARDHYGENDGRPDAMARIFRKMAAEIERDYIPKSDHEKALSAIVEAQSEGDEQGERSAHYVMRAYAEAKGMPFGDCGTISEWLDRWFIKRPLYEDREPFRFEHANVKWSNPGLWIPNAISKDGQVLAIGCREVVARAKTTDSGLLKRRAYPCELAYREPDNLEKLRDDIQRTAYDLEDTPRKEMRDSLALMADRLTALIERGE